MKRSDTAPFRTTGTGGRYYLDGGVWWITKVTSKKWRLVERTNDGWIVHSEETTLAGALRYYREKVTT
jgi:hypothetical protein